MSIWDVTDINNNTTPTLCSCHENCLHWNIVHGGDPVPAVPVGGAVGHVFWPAGHMTAACVPLPFLAGKRHIWQGGRAETEAQDSVNTELKMLALINRLLDWFRSLFWKEEMELTLVGLQYSGKTTFVNVIAVSLQLLLLATSLGQC